MKIKTTKTMNLPQLIEHIVETSYECNKYIADNAKSSIYVGSIKGVVVEGTIFPTDTFTVAVEEEITEDTVLPRIVEIDLCGYDQHEDVFMQENKSINQILNEDEVKKRAFYILNDDLTMTLIWREGKLIEE